MSEVYRRAFAEVYARHWEVGAVEVLARYGAWCSRFGAIGRRHERP